MTPELGALHEARRTPGQIAGFTVVAGEPLDGPLERKGRAAGILAAFAGPYGRGRTSGALGGIEWAGALPGPTESLSTWSHHADDAGVCVVEGDFYAEAFGRRPRIGVDDSLARTVLAELLRRGPDSVNELNGLFSGFAYSRERRRLWFFVDPTGSRMLYYRLENGACEVSSNVYGFPGGGAPLRLDPLAVNEDMAFGAPLDHRTLFQGVRLVAPGRVVEFDGERLLQHRYFRFPRRRDRMSRGEISEMIDGAMESRVRYLGLGGKPSCIGLSGGKDSRVVCSAVVTAGLRPLALTFLTSDRDEDGLLGLRLAKATGLPSETVNLHHIGDTEEAVGASSDAAILSDGFTAGFGFLVLAACAARHSRLLFTGFAGDCLSGSWSGVEPWRASTVEELSGMNRDLLGYVVPPALASASLLPEYRVPENELVEDWLDCYRREQESCGDLVSTHIGIRIGLRNRRWAASFYQAMRVASTPVQLFGARDVMEAYLTIPVSALKGQRAHIWAAGHRVPAIADIPSSKTLGKVPLKWEPYLRLPLRLRYSRRVRRRKSASQLPGARPTGSASRRNAQFAEALLAATMTDKTYLRREFLPQPPPEFRKAMHKMAATAMHAEYGLNRTFLVPPFFLPAGGTD
jgi:asparagine synthetase B (glutamine-hydrolysing)